MSTFVELGVQIKTLVPNPDMLQAKDNTALADEFLKTRSRQNAVRARQCLSQLSCPLVTMIGRMLAPGHSSTVHVTSWSTLW